MLCSPTPIPTSPPPESPSHSLRRCQQMKMEAGLEEPGRAIWGHTRAQGSGHRGLGAVHLVRPSVPCSRCRICNIQEPALPLKHRKGDAEISREVHSLQSGPCPSPPLGLRGAAPSREPVLAAVPHPTASRRHLRVTTPDVRGSRGAEDCCEALRMSL